MRRTQSTEGERRMGAQAHRATKSTRPADVDRRWHVIDAEDQVLGRLSTRVATILRGKHKATYTPHVDTGDFVIVVNAEKVRLTGNKREQKTYHRHTGYVGHVRSVTADKLLGGPHADRVVRSAVSGMLPKNSLGRQMLRKLKIYAGPDHPHAAQKPEELTLG
jgi:large subunit ribosomal protein L13